MEPSVETRKRMGRRGCVPDAPADAVRHAPAATAAAVRLAAAVTLAVLAAAAGPIGLAGGGASAAPAAGQEARPADLSEGRVKIVFDHVDSDGNGWISLFESDGGLRFDRGRFRTFDLDRDGRLDFAEFGAFFRAEVAAKGTAPGPASLPPAGPPPRRDAQQLRIAYDRDLDRLLDAAELTALLRDYGRTDLDVPTMLANLDASGDARLGLAELARLATFLDPLMQGAMQSSRAPIARTLDELFGAVVERAGSGQAPQIIGPVRPFRRLDLDGDGFVAPAELDSLLGRLHTSISPRAVMSALDRDGDGRLSEAEFVASIDPSARRAESNALR